MKSYDLIIQGFKIPPRTTLPAKHSFSVQVFRLWKAISDADLLVAAIGTCEALGSRALNIGLILGVQIIFNAHVREAYIVWLSKKHWHCSVFR